MTLEMQTALERELKDAKTSEDRALAQFVGLNGAARALGKTRAEIDSFLDAIPAEGGV